MLKSSSSVQLVLETTRAGRSGRSAGSGEGMDGEPELKSWDAMVVTGVDAGGWKGGRKVVSGGSSDGMRRRKSWEACEQKSSRETRSAYVVQFGRRGLMEMTRWSVVKHDFVPSA